MIHVHANPTRRTTEMEWICFLVVVVTVIIIYPKMDQFSNGGDE